MDIGTQLRQARESRGFSLAQLAARIRVNARVLENLERNDLTAVPPRPYARGFVASYAREVGLNSEETVRNYFAQFEEVAPPVAAPAPARPRVPLDDDRWRPLPVVAAVLLIVLLGTFAVGRLRSPSPPAGEAPVGTTGRVPAGDPTLGAANTVQPARPAEGGAAAGTGAAVNGLVVALEAESSSWVSARVDGERKIYQMIQPGTKHTLRASREIVLRVGDAGALRWSINGREAVPIGRRGEVRTIRLTPGDQR